MLMVLPKVDDALSCGVAALYSERGSDLCEPSVPYGAGLRVR